MAVAASPPERRELTDVSLPRTSTHTLGELEVTIPRRFLKDSPPAGPPPRPAGEGVGARFSNARTC